MKKQDRVHKVWKILEDEFDWVTVRKIMLFLDWKWALKRSEQDVDRDVPQVYELKRVALKLLQMLMELDKKELLNGKDQTVASMSSGGFRAIRYVRKGKPDDYELLFVLSSAEYCVRCVKMGG